MKFNQLPNDILDLIFEIKEQKEKEEKEIKYNKNKFNFVIKELKEKHKNVYYDFLEYQHHTYATYEDYTEYINFFYLNHSNNISKSILNEKLELYTDNEVEREYKMDLSLKLIDTLNNKMLKEKENNFYTYFRNNFKDA